VDALVVIWRRAFRRVPQNRLCLKFASPNVSTGVHGPHTHHALVGMMVLTFILVCTAARQIFSLIALIAVQATSLQPPWSDF